MSMLYILRLWVGKQLRTGGLTAQDGNNGKISIPRLHPEEAKDGFASPALQVEEIKGVDTFIKDNRKSSKMCGWVRAKQTNHRRVIDIWDMVDGVPALREPDSLSLLLILAITGIFRMHCIHRPLFIVGQPLMICDMHSAIPVHQQRQAGG